MNAVEARCLNVRLHLGTGSPFSMSLKISSKAEGHWKNGWRPFHHLGCCKRDDSCSLRLTCIAILITELDTSFCHLIWVLVGRFCCCFSPNFLPVARLHVMETLSTHLLCNMHYVFDTILRIFCDIFKTFKIFQFGQMFPQQLLMVACLMLSQAVLIWSLMLHMVTDFQYSSMVGSLLVLRASKAWLKAPWHKVPWKLFFFFVVNFVIHWNETAMGLHVFPIPIPPPTSLSTRSP